MGMPRLDQKLLEKLGQKLNKPLKYVREQVSKRAGRSAITSEAALILMAREVDIGTASYFRKQPPHVQDQVRAASFQGGIPGSVSVAAIGEKAAPRTRRISSATRARLRARTSQESQDEVASLLDILHRDLGAAYRQVLRDLDDESRLSYRGTANEIREVLSETIRLLAPEEDVKGQAWYRPEGGRDGPTRAQRLQFIFKRVSLDENMSSAEEGAELVEQGVHNLYSRVLRRSQRATHTSQDRSEVRRILAYATPVLLDILNAAQRAGLLRTPRAS